MFRGSYEAKITEGRLKLPTDFEKLVNATGNNQFYITSPDGKSAEIWPLPEWEKTEAKLAEHSTMDDDVQAYLFCTSLYGQQVEMDKQARVSLPKTLREEAKLEGEVRVMGMLHYMVVTNLEVVKERMAASQLTKEGRAHVAQILKSPGKSGTP
jgi:MraZ protein